MPVLHQLIRLKDDALAEFLGRYVTWALETYLQAKQGLQMFTPFNPFASISSTFDFWPLTSGFRPSSRSQTIRPAR